MNDLPFALTVQEAACALKIGKNTTYALIHSGALRSVRVGRQIRVPQKALEEFLGNTA